MYNTGEVVSTILLCIGCQRNIHIHDTLSISEGFIPFSRGTGHFVFVVCKQCKDLRIEYETSEVLEQKDKLSKAWKRVYSSASNLYLFHMTRKEAVLISPLVICFDNKKTVTPVIMVSTIQDNITKDTILKSIVGEKITEPVNNFL